ncbi:MAG: hypothetical protein KF691_15075 [Phycisphaeraceae bacterium]|nr:hypothetical protein [Phycisphaeraceae bacterium]
MTGTDDAMVNTEMIEASSPDDPARFLRRHFSGTILSDEVVLRRNFVIDPRSGEIVASLPPNVEEAQSVVLHVPDEADGALQLLVECRALDAARDGACDRLLIYHGRSEGAKFVGLTPVDGKLNKKSFQIEKKFASNPLWADEPRICRVLNSDSGALRTLVKDLSGREVIEPKAVGVDDIGLDVRTRTGLVRVEFERRLACERAAATIESWLSRH